MMKRGSTISNQRQNSSEAVDESRWPTSKKAKSIANTAKIIATTIFTPIDHIENNKIITGEYSAPLFISFMKKAVRPDLNYRRQCSSIKKVKAFEKRIIETCTIFVKFDYL